MSSDSPNQTWTVCSCNHCSQHLEFEASNAGETIQCPHCKLDTVLFVPNVPAETPAPPEPAPKPLPRIEPINAEMVEQTTYNDLDMGARLELTQVNLSNRSNKVAESLESAGDFFFALGVIGLIIGLLGAFISIADVKSGEAGIWFVVGVVAGIQGFVIRLLFRAGAEIIHVLKDASKFTGKITQLSFHRSYKCSLCNTTAQPDQVRCSRCGAKFNPR